MKLLLLEESKLGNVHSRAYQFANETGAKVNIESVSIKNWQSEVFADAKSNGPRTFDGYSVKGNWIPSLAEEGGIASLSELVETYDSLFSDLRWLDIVPVVRDSICVYDQLIYSIPIDADYIVTAIRDDLLLNESSSLETWEEWVDFAVSHNNTDINGDGVADYGTCVAAGEGETHFSIFAVLWAMVAPHVQTKGRQTGAFFDTETFLPIWENNTDIQPKFHRALELYKKLISVNIPGEVTALQAMQLFQSGRCATWMSLPGFVFTVQDMGGIKTNTTMTSASMKRIPAPGVECDNTEECPTAVQLEDGRLINRVPFFATSGAGLSISSSTSDTKSQLLLELYTYISSPDQSNSDVTLRQSFSDPFRQSQLSDEATNRLVQNNNWSREEAESYHEVVSETLNNEEGALDLRVPGIDLYMSSTLETLSPYVYTNHDNITSSSTSTAQSIADLWNTIPTKVFPDSSADEATAKMRGIYRAQLGLPPMVEDVAKPSSSKSIVLELTITVVVSLAILLAIFAYVYVEKRKKSGDSVWAVKHKELKFDDPPVVVGRGTFGLVLLAEYRGTMVAVKRVIPPRVGANNNTSTKSNTGDSTDSNGIESVQLKRTSILGSGDRDESSNRTYASKSPFDFRSHGKEEDEEKGLESEITVRTQTYAHTSSSGWSSADSTADKASTIIRKFSKTRYEKLKTEFIVEMRILSKLRHPCITTVMGAVIDTTLEPMLIMEYMDFGSLHDLLHNETITLDGDLLLPIVKDISQGLRFLHAADPQVLHGDIKSQNVLVDSKFRAKVADFGLSQKKVGSAGATGTPLWMAPELLRGESTNTAASDMYSFGIIFYEVYSRKDPYDGENISLILREVADPNVNRRPPIPPAMPPKVKDIMTDCLQGNANDRPTFEQLDLRIKKLNVECVEPGMNFSKVRRSCYTNQLKVAEDLLYDVFPPHIADALRKGKKVEQETHGCVTIFFSDVVGFTTISQGSTPQKVCKMMDRLFKKFDDLTRKHDIFKCETIGDAYMAITNLVKDQNNDHVKRVAAFSKDAIKASAETLIDEDDPSKGYLQIRVGFHSGPVIADVIGSRLPKFGVFGDAVNTASRMESNSETMRIHCSEVSAKLLMTQDPTINVTSRGKIKIKGKGEMHTY